MEKICIKCHKPINTNLQDYSCEAKGLRIFGITIFKRRFNFEHHNCEPEEVQHR